MTVQKRRLLVCDLDNTLYDWVSYFVPSLYAMVDMAVEIMKCDRDQLLNDLRSVHQRHHDSEHPFALLETETVRKFYGGYSRAYIADALNPAFHAFNSSRKKNLRLNQGVIETLDLLVSQGIKLIAHTDSRLHGALDRIHRFGLGKYFSRIYCRERTMTSHPNPEIAQNWFGRFSMEYIHELSNHQSKPNPTVLMEICSRERIQTSDAAYIGDSIAKDILMARNAGVYAIWAAYGAEHDSNLYAALVRVSHWTKEDVLREKLLKEEASSIKPDFIAANSFSEVLTALSVADLQHAR